jgi:uncharacterized protein (DUF433 family)
MEKNLLNRIEENPGVMLGKPVIKGTRIIVEIILEKIAYGSSEEEILKSYPNLKKDDIKDAILYAAKFISATDILAV